MIYIILLIILFCSWGRVTISQTSDNRLAPPKKPNYVPGEILVKFKTHASASTIQAVQKRLGIEAKGELKYLRVHHLKLPKDMDVETALEIYRKDPNVEYAEPNHIRYLYSNYPNDYFGPLLWGLHNTGQSVNGFPGTEDADIDAPEAWDITTDCDRIVIAVIDSGIDYNHPDLVQNIWRNSNEIPGNGYDDDRNGFVDDIRGWDFYANDNNPIDSNGHGTHVAAIIAARANDEIGVAGVCWKAQIMPLRVGGPFLTVADTSKAIEYAVANGAKVINASYGGPIYNAAEYNAISLANSAGILFVAAAGNSDPGTNNDSTPQYPSGYALPNIISVAATDQDDKLADFSNYGPASVDVAAPGVNIYSAKPARQTVNWDNFDDGDILPWTTGGNYLWGISNVAYNDLYSLSDSPTGNYQNNTTSWAETPDLNLSSQSGSRLDFKFRGESESSFDFLYVQTSLDGLSWTNQDIFVGYPYLQLFPDISGSTSGYWVDGGIDLGAYDGQSLVYIRFYFTSNQSNTFDGWYIDKVALTTSFHLYDMGGGAFQYKAGTSMAAPYVSGLAALIWSFDSTRTMAQVKDINMKSVDKKESLEGKILPGGRINAFNALYYVPPQAPVSLSASAASASQINLSWTDNSPNESGFYAERKTGANGTYAQIATLNANVATYSDTGLSGSTTYYYRLSAYNNGGPSSYSAEASATTPAPPSGGGGGGGGGCFIATAAYGSPMAKEVAVLQDFRDRILLQTALGEILVKLYYKISPPIAQFIAERDTLRMMVRWSLIPVVGISSIAVKAGPMVTVLIFGLVILAGGCASRVYAHRKRQKGRREE